MNNEELYAAAQRAIDELYNDKSVSVQTAIENLQSLQYDIEIYIEGLKLDLK